MQPPQFISFLALCLSAAAMLAPLAKGATIIVNASSTGQSNRSGTSASANESTPTIVAGKSGTIEWRGFVSFDLSALSEPVAAATLRIAIDAYTNNATFLNLVLWDYTSGAPPGSIIGGSTLARFQDLGSGLRLGAMEINATQNPAGTVLQIPLSNAGIDAINSGAAIYSPSQGVRIFTIGLADGNTGSATSSVRMVSGATVNRLTVQTVPEPGAAGLLCMLLPFAAGRFRDPRAQTASVDGR